MKNFITRRSVFAPLALLSIGSLTLSGCFEKDHEGDCNGPTGSTCDTAATVVDLSATTGCGLALQLADSTYLIPTGRTWTNFQPAAGQKVTIGYHVEKNDGDEDDQTTCPAGTAVELGCITLVPKAT